jgi:heme exporter protein CcmD
MNILWDAHFWAMGGYGAFVWAAYGVSALGLGGSAILTFKAWRNARARLARLEAGMGADGREGEKA